MASLSGPWIQRRYRMGSIKRLGYGRWLRRSRKAIDSNPPRHAGQKRALVINTAPPAIAIKFQERLLNGILGIGAIEQHGIGDAEHESRLALDHGPRTRFIAASQGLAHSVSALIETHKTCWLEMPAGCKGYYSPVYTQRRRCVAGCSEIFRGSPKAKL